MPHVSLGVFLETRRGGDYNGRRFANRRPGMRALITAVALFMLAGCAGQEIQRKDGSSSARPFSMSNLVKAEATWSRRYTSAKCRRVSD